MQFILYCLCGGIGVSVDYSIYYFALRLGFWYQAANSLGYLAGTLVSFSLNRKITFGINDQIAQRLLIFLGVAAIGFSGSAFILWLMVDVLSIDAMLSKSLTLPLVVIIQFSLNRRLTFKVQLR